jgi:hypothetical protein
MRLTLGNSFVVDRQSKVVRKIVQKIVTRKPLTQDNKLDTKQSMAGY